MSGQANLEDGLDAKVEGRAGALPRPQLLLHLRAHLARRHVVAQRLRVCRALLAGAVALGKLQRFAVPICLHRHEADYISFWSQGYNADWESLP